ncbi:thioredoxin domain-containing protein [uncultured Phycicoccus sp.]|uniref:DsbA family protein n=1 Tax=uncultured Phycicoccus sp. TaxID=661422 RepID=UPI00260645A3|nr:thioredoxin domain-containing protein [uncultured Phycicoccus sp.]
MQTQPTSTRRRSVVVPTLIAVIALVLTVVAVVASRPDPSAAKPGAADRSSAGSGAEDPLAQLPRRTPGDPLAVGDPDAPVVMVSYSEFQCPFCGKFARDTEPGLIEKYVEDGTLRIEWRDFPYLGEESTTAALAGRAAALQGKFWEFHDAVYAEQRPVNGGVLTEEYLASLARDAGLDGDRLVEDMARPELAEAVRADFAEGQALGVTGTPAFIVNGQPIIGAQPAEVFEQAIENAADAAR